MKRLSLSGSHLTGLSYDSLSLYTKLTTIDTDHAADMTNDNLLSVLRMQRLRQLSIADGRLLFGDNFKSLFKNKQFPQLRQLFIFECDKLDNVALFTLIMCCQRLEKLYLDNLIAITNEVLVQIMTYRRNSCLELLTVCQCPGVSANHVARVQTTFAELGVTNPRINVV